MEKDQPKKTWNKSNRADRAANIHAFVVVVMFVFRFPIMGVPNLFWQIRNGQRRQMSNDQQANHNGNHQHPEHAKITDSQSAEYGSTQEGNPINSANKSISLISPILRHQDGYKCRERN